MAGRSQPTFKKRQKEQARKEKQRNKAERRAQRKLEKLAASAGPQPEIAADLSDSEAATDSEPSALPLPNPGE